MGSKWIPINKELPELEELVWVLVKSPEYYDTEDNKKVEEAWEVFIGKRDVCRVVRKGKLYEGYRYQLTFPNLEDSFDMYGETIEYDWGQRCEIVAWMPMNMPEAVFDEEMG